MGGQCGPSTQKYVKTALKTVKEVISNREFELPTTAKAPFSSKNSPELDITPKLDDNDPILCQE